MDIEALKEKVRQSHDKHFGATPLSSRLADIQREVVELISYRDDSNLREEFGDVLWSLLQLANENGYDAAACVLDTIRKLDIRKEGKKA